MSGKAALAALLAAVLLVIGIRPVSAAPDEKVLVAYSDPQARTQAMIMNNLLDHFDVEHDLLRLTGAEETRVKAYDRIVYVDSLGKAHDDSAVETLLRKLDRPLLWIGYGDFARAMSGIQVRYGERSYEAESFLVAGLDPADPAASEKAVRFATATDGREERPLIVRRDDQWLVTAYQFAGLVHWIVADVLHDFLGHAHASETRGMLKIEDVHPLINPERLTAIADLLASYGMPYTISVVPVFYDAKSGRTHTPRDHPKWVEAIRYMVENGGTVVLDGYSHDGIGSAEAANDLLEREIAVLSDLGLYPIAFNFMYESVPAAHYDQVLAHFTTTLGQVQVHGDTPYFQEVPYALYGPGGRVYPETAGYLSEPADMGRLLHRVGQLSVVRDAFVGVSYYPSVPLERLADMLQWIGTQSIVWTNIRYEAHEVGTDFIRIRVPGDGTLDVSILDLERLERLSVVVQENGSIRSITYYVSWGLAILVMVFLLLFTIFILYLRARRRVRLFAEREEVAL